MSALLANRDCSLADAARYARHHPEQTLLYQLVERHYLAFLAELEAQGHTLQKYVQQEFDDFLKCGPLHHLPHRDRSACRQEGLHLANRPGRRTPRG